MEGKHGKKISRIYGFTLIILLIRFSWALAQIETTPAAQNEQELSENVQINVVSTVYTLKFSLAGEDKDKYTIENVTCSTGSGKPIVADEQHVCKELDPCSYYTSVVTLGVTDPTLTPPGAQTIHAYTEYKAPRTDITSLEATSHTIKITWKTTDRACVEKFVITANTSYNNVYNTEQPKGSSSYIFDNRLACQTYNVTLETFNNASVRVDLDWKQIDTDYSEPGDLKLQIKNLTNGETEISWDDPQDYSCIGNYTFNWARVDCEISTTELPITQTTLDMNFEALDTSEPPEETAPDGSSDQCGGSDVLLTGTKRNFVLRDLQGCELHSIEVYINLNKTRKAAEQFVSAEKMASAVWEPSHNLLSTDLRWTWSPPRDHFKCVKEYRVKITGPTQRANPNTTQQFTPETSAVFKDLDPCGNYKVEIVPMSLNGSAGASYKSESTIEEDKPSAIREPVVRPGSNSLNISWLTPAYGDLCIDGYRLSGWMDDGKDVNALSVTTQNNNVSFDKDLLSCQAYTIQIIPFSTNLDGEMKHLHVETTAAVVNADKIALQLVNKGSASHSLELKATSQDNENSCQTIFAYFNCTTKAKVKYTFAEKYVEAYSTWGFQALLSPLSPFTSYDCSVVLYNVAGSSKAKTVLGSSTEKYFPDQPREVQLSQSNSDSLEFTWQPPLFLNGQFQYYQPYLTRYEPDYYVPPDAGCSVINDDPKSDANPLAVKNFTGLHPAVKYIMQVAVQNDFGLGQYTLPIIGTTKPSVSDAVTNLQVLAMGPTVDNNTYSANVTISWTVPCKSNGEIEWFALDFTGERHLHEPIEFKRNATLDKRDPRGRMSYIETEMQPEYNYRVKVAVKTLNVEQLSESVDQTWLSPAGLPAGLGEDLVGQMRVNAYETNHPTSSALVRLPADILNSESGNITYVALLLSQKNCAGVPRLQYDILHGNEWPSIPSYEEVSGNDCIYQYQTTPELWDPDVSSGESRSSADEIVYVIGAEKCGNPNTRYCNGPLKADTEYNMVVRLFTQSGYNDAALLEFKTDSAIKVTLILVSVCSCLLMAFVLGLAVLWVRKRIAWHRDSGQGIEDPFGNVIAKNFAIFYEEVSKPEKLAREFKEITVVALELSYAASELGSHKNRYADIYPYDKNRVILDIDAEGSDYINASFIDGHTRKKEYIATQGPKPESVMDFWRMILQHNVRIIVQVTQFREGNTIKCHEYFPYNMRGLVVTIKSKECFDLYDRTELSVVHDKYGLKEKVIHFYFKKWPDHGCPEDPQHLISFVKKVKAERRPNFSPIVVHCSAGVGRTGTFIGLDLIMQRLKNESKINIFETVKKLRFQRMKMVQTQQQYAFLYACTYELVKHKIPRAALKLEGGRPKSVTPTTKKVSFPDVDMAHGEGGSVLSTPDPELGIDVPTLQLPPRLGGLRKANSKGVNGHYDDSIMSII